MSLKSFEHRKGRPVEQPENPLPHDRYDHFALRGPGPQMAISRFASIRLSPQAGGQLASTRTRTRRSRQAASLPSGLEPCETPEPTCLPLTAPARGDLALSKPPGEAS